MLENRTYKTEDQLCALPTADGEITPLRSVRDVIDAAGALGAYYLIPFAERNPAFKNLDPNDRDITTNNVTWQQGR